MDSKIFTKEDMQIFKQDLLKELSEMMQRRSPKEHREWLKTYEVMKALNISKRTLQSFRANGTLPFTRIGKCIYFKSDDIRSLLEQNKIHRKSIR